MSAYSDSVDFLRWYAKNMARSDIHTDDLNEAASELEELRKECKEYRAELNKIHSDLGHRSLLCNIQEFLKWLVKLARPWKAWN